MNPLLEGKKRLYATYVTLMAFIIAITTRAKDAYKETLAIRESWISADGIDRRGVSLMGLIMIPVLIVVYIAVFTSVYPMITSYVTTYLTNATSPGYVGIGWVGLANLIPTLFIIGFLVGLIGLTLELLREAGIELGGGGSTGGSIAKGW